MDNKIAQGGTKLNSCENGQACGKADAGIPGVGRGFHK